jgi:hypothetical protein
MHCSKVLLQSLRALWRWTICCQGLQCELEHVAGKGQGLRSFFFFFFLIEKYIFLYCKFFFGGGKVSWSFYLFIFIVSFSYFLFYFFYSYVHTVFGLNISSWLLSRLQPGCKKKPIRKLALPSICETWILVFSKHIWGVTFQHFV